MKPLVLLVEDSGVQAAIVSARLRMPPCRAEVAHVATLAEARSALDAMRRFGDMPRMVVLDLGLPDGSGLDLLPLLQGVPVVLCTAEPADAPPGHAVAAKGASGWLRLLELAVCWAGAR